MPATVSTIVFDCADPGAPAEFYRTATGWKVLADRAGHVFCLIPAEQS
ncbi:MAG TPA: VOC family protein [Pseudonocardiaceae bacterium]|nr:VOC family protein [Pseudonocardiaceae bacterium]